MKNNLVNEAVEWGAYGAGVAMGAGVVIGIGYLCVKAASGICKLVKNNRKKKLLKESEKKEVSEEEEA